VIGKIGVSAQLSYKTVPADGIMPNPNGPDDIAVYEVPSHPGLGGLPGAGGNTVLSGHVDWGAQHGIGCNNNTVPAPCRAVFWDLHTLRVGDEVEMQVNGRSLKYRVTSNQAVSAANADWDGIVRSTAQESITIITCGGDFNQVTREYSSRQVVTAVRI
jgi:LPXTG-site transpeptidase (sortase) family protein